MPYDDIDGKTVIVTGGGAGMGRESALLFAEHGANVAVADIDVDAADDTCTVVEDRDYSGDATSIQVDVTEERAVEEMIAATVETFGGLDVLFNNVGIVHQAIPIEELDEETWDEIQEVNVKSAYFGAKHVVPHLRENGGGDIIQNASISANQPRPGTHAYSASKGAMIALTKALAVELAEDDIRVNAISSTASQTSLLDDLVDEGGESYVDTDQIVASIPLGRLVDPKEVAHAAVYLASDVTRDITGIDLAIDGGRSIFQG